MRLLLQMAVLLLHAKDTPKALTLQLQQVRAGPENGSHSKRSAALGSQHHEPSFGFVMRLSHLPTISKGERQSRRTDAHSSL